MKARAILRTLIEEVRNPDIANGPAAMRACLDAEKLFKEEEEDGLQVGSSEEKIPRAGGPGENAQGHIEGIRGGDSEGKAPGKSPSRTPRGKASQAKGMAN